MFPFCNLQRLLAYSQVINVYMPNSLKQYIHRVGRTARAGLSGRSVSLVGDQERKLLRDLVKGVCLLALSFLQYYFLSHSFFSVTYL
jgi:superfamily II DNA/RNA helicase